MRKNKYGNKDIADKFDKAWKGGETMVAMVVSMDLRNEKDQLKIGAQLLSNRTRKLDKWKGFY